MSKEHKTAEEILKQKLDELNQHDGSYPSYKHTDVTVKEFVLEAMEEYASQYKSALEEREMEIQGVKSHCRIIEDALETVGLLLKDSNAELSTLRAEKSQPIDVEGLRDEWFNNCLGSTTMKESIWNWFLPYLSKGTKQE